MHACIYLSKKYSLYTVQIFSWSGGISIWEKKIEEEEWNGWRMPSAMYMQKVLCSHVINLPRVIICNIIQSNSIRV